MIEQREQIILMVSPEGIILSLSEAARHFFLNSFSCKPESGVSISELNFLPLSDFFFALPKEKKASRSVTLPSGKTLRITLTGLFDSEKQIGVSCVIEDLFLESLQREQINKLSLVALNTPNAVMICDEEGDIEWVNRGFSELTGFSAEEVIGKGPFELLYDKRASQETRARLLERVERGESVNETFVNYTPSGKPYCIQLIVSPIKNETGKILNYVAIGTDVSEKMREVHELQDRNLLFDSISKSLPLLLCVYDLEKNHIEYINEHVHELIGYTPEEIKIMSEQDLSRIVEKQDLLKLKASLASLFNDNSLSSVNCELSLIHKLGEIKFINATHIVFRRNFEGNPTHILGSVVDITEKRKSELYRESVAKLQELQQKKLQRIRSLTLLQGQEEERKRISRELHDGIGQLLTAIHLKLNSFGDVVPQANEYRQSVTFLREMVSKTIQEVRSVSYALVPVDLFDFGLDAALLQLCESSKKEGLSVQFHSNLERKRLNTTIEIELYRIAQEAINNSVKYSSASSLDVQIAANENKGVIRLMIIDNGVGFDFDPDYIYKKNTRRSFGLRNMHERSRIINGKLTIISAREQGCVISVEAPLKVNEL